MEYLNLSSNQIERIFKETFENNMKLNELNLSDNKLKEISAKFNDFNHLNTLDLSKNSCINGKFDFSGSLNDRDNERYKIQTAVISMRCNGK